MICSEKQRSDADAKRYYQRYLDAITAIGEAGQKNNIEHKPSISVKLSALHPRFEVAQSAWMLPELLEKMQALLSKPVKKVLLSRLMQKRWNALS